MQRARFARTTTTCCAGIPTRENADVAVVHWHWILPSVARAVQDANQAGEDSRSTPHHQLHAYHLDYLAPDWTPFSALVPDHRSRILKDVERHLPGPHLASQAAFSGFFGPPDAVAWHHELVPAGNPCAGLVALSQRCNC